ncbi:MAG: aldehyde:ferredoxin oxidoreductase, partial [Deltaproteobacteria bacterium]
MLSGYAGKIAWIDLTGKEFKVQALEQDAARKHLGGKGLGAYLLYRNQRPRTNPYDSENTLIFITGPLTGTTFPA